MKFIFGEFEVGIVAESSGMWCGDNIIIQRTNCTKLNEGFGTSSGQCNRIDESLHFMIDRDFIDRFIPASSE